MPSKKKGKKHLSEEENVKQAEMKALTEKEKLIRRRKLTNAFLKLKKEKEYELLKVNDSKLLDLWRPRLRKLKCEEILEDYKMLQAGFERNYRKKDELIGDMENVIGQNDENYDNAFDSHLHNIDQLMEFYRKRLNEIRDMYGEQRHTLLNVLNEEKHRMENYQEKSLRYLNGVIAAVNMRYKELASESRAEVFIRQEEMRNKAMEETHAAKQETDKRMRAVWDEVQTLLVTYDTKITPLRNEFMELRKKDDVVVSTIDEQFRKMFKLQIGIENLAEKDKKYCATLNNLLSNLNSKRDDLKTKYKLQQSRFDFVAKMGKDNIRNLALVSGSLLEWLDELTRQRERLLKCIERCMKRERLDEKVDPFMKRWHIEELGADSEESDNLNTSATIDPGPNSSPDVTPQGDSDNFTPKRMEHHVTCDCSPCTCAVQFDIQENPADPVLSTVADFAMLDRFWTRLNRASLELRCLCQRKQSMVEDNLQLKMALRNYMGGMNPLQYNLETLPNQLLSNAQREYEIVVRSLLRELKRKARCRNVGGIKVH